MNTNTITTEKEVYQAPKIEIIQMETEGVLAGSGASFGNGGGYDGWSSSARSRYQRNNSMNDLEDMINDILTFEK